MAMKQFQAESKRLLDLMINSIYTHKEIFLREIISNASDAIDKLAYLSLTEDNGMSRDDFAIHLSVDKEHRVLTISDNGIGMTEEDMENNLGTIAKSGSLAFKEEMKKAEKPDEAVDIIGQFGVGFYSAFMVADNVTVISKKYGTDQAYMWQSQGADGYEIIPCERDTCGTDVILKLKDNTEDEDYDRYLSQYTLQNLVKKYSDYIRYPIRMEMTSSRPVEQEDENGEKKTTYEEFTEEKTLNSMVPIWQKNKDEVTEEEYDQYYQDKFGDYEKPTTRISVSVEGNITYKALLYVPSRAPYDFYSKEYKKGLQLYSNGVMIMENCEDLLPDYFCFVKGIVDSPDLSLNISREMLQHDRQLKRIASNLEKKIKSELSKLLTNDREKYEKFFEVFGVQMKYGVVSDYGAHKDVVKDLLLFWSQKNEKYVTLAEYVAEMPEEQKYIYYAAGESRVKLGQLPQTELVRDKGYDILFLTDDVDEFIMNTLMNYQEKEFKSVSAEDLGLETDEEKQEKEQETKENQGLLDFVKEALGEKLKEVRLSNKLRSHPVCLVPDSGLSFEMEKYLNRVAPNEKLKTGRIMELNADHPAFAALKNAFENDQEKAKKYAELLYCQALLIADLPLEDPSAYTDLVCSLMQ
ncbi:MAG: molecular chaperone HtpG [Oscillospiraceae bacterium]|nr:molecular chaperone HtpG [Oscillospiraceae bacterium]